MSNIFVYGTLMERGQLEHVLGHKYDGEFEVAVLRNFVRLQPSYYMAFEEEGSEIVGKLVSNLDDGDMAKLDRYEGVDTGFYRRQEVLVGVGIGDVRKLEDAYVYYNGDGFNKEDYK